MGCTFKAITLLVRGKCFREVATRSNKKAFFRYLRSERQRKETVAQLLNEDGKMITEDKEKAEVLNTYFSSVSVFPQRTDYGPPHKCEVQVEGTGF